MRPGVTKFPTQRERTCSRLTVITMLMEPADTNRPDPHDLCKYGSVGVLATRPDSIQCHICGEWWTSLAAHAQQTHDLSADEYRATFGLMNKTKLVAPALKRAEREAFEVGVAVTLVTDDCEMLFSLSYAIWSWQ